ncbi:MAG: GspH/FimT family pseudopilin [Pseudomonadota bacterium]|nr:GspH/FimT family pseudopilin [Pseudomonadota bacterium]
MKKVHPQVQAGLAARAAGFTVLELMITVAVLGILLGIGVPSFQGIIRQNRIAGQTNELLAATAMARSEAVKRGSTVTICPATSSADGDANTCSGTTAWGNGWIIFSDEVAPLGQINIDGTLPDDVIIQRSPPSAPQRMTITNNAITSLTYRGDGSTTLGIGARTTFIVAPNADYCEDPLGARDVTVSATGRVNATKVNCP